MIILTLPHREVEKLPLSKHKEIKESGTPPQLKARLKNKTAKVILIIRLRIGVPRWSHSQNRRAMRIVISIEM
jgi:hypothetical protein